MTEGNPIDASAQILLSICIPTYNRARELRRCLQRVVPQLTGRPVELVVIDNASPDQTAEVVREFTAASPALRYIRNASNLGYTGNQEKCLTEGRGEYTAILCDDDVYELNAVETILKTLPKGPFSFVAINYYAFEGEPENVMHPSVAPSTEDFEAADAYKVLNYPGVGHYSGYIVRTELGRAVVPRVKQLYSPEQMEHGRGLLGPAMLFAIKSSNLPGYFIGTPIMGAARPSQVDYDSLGHLCMDTYRFWYDMMKAGILTHEDIARREADVLGLLPRAVIRNGGSYSGVEIAKMRAELKTWFDGDPRFKRTAFLMGLMQFGVVRAAARGVVRLYSKKREFNANRGSSGS